MDLITKPRNFFNQIRCMVEEKKYTDICSSYNINGYSRIYLIHIRKTAGTSLNNMFLALANTEPEKLYKELSSNNCHRVCSGGLVYVGWNIRLINNGNYYYAFSHIPIHKLKLPVNTFTVTCFRDPVERVISLYNMLMEYKINGIPHPCMKTEGKWLGNSFDDFIDSVPEEHLLNQVYMFSNSFNVDEALINIRKVNHVMFTEDFDAGVEKLNIKAGLSLKSMNIRKTIYSCKISDNALRRLEKLLEKEYSLIKQVKEEVGS